MDRGALGQGSDARESDEECEFVAIRLSAVKELGESVGCSEEKDIEVQEPQSPRLGVDALCPRPERLPAVSPGQASPRRLRPLRVVQGSSGRRGRLIS